MTPDRSRISRRTVITAALLGFLAVAVGAVIRQQFRAGPGTSAGDAPLPRRGVVVWYFHTSADCDACRKASRWSREAADMPGEPVSWREVNFELPANRELARRYDVTAMSVVLSRHKDGRELGHKDLADMWDRLGDREEFVAYVRGEVARALEEIQ